MHELGGECMSMAVSAVVMSMVVSAAVMSMVVVQQ